MSLSGKTKGLLIIGGGTVLAGGALFFFKGGAVVDTLTSAAQSVTEDILAVALPSPARPYVSVIKRVADEQNVSAFLIAALGMRETNWGNSIGGPGGTGDSGHGRGLMQIDDRTWTSWLAANDWKDPYTNVTKGMQIWKAGRDYLQQHGVPDSQLDAGATAAYNAGPGTVLKRINAGQSPDVATTGGNYGSDVIARANSYAAAAQSA